MKITHTTISLNDLKFYAYHGVMAQENKVGAHYTVNVRITFTADLEALKHDELHGTVNYAQVYDDIKTIMNIPHKLLESVAYDMVQLLFDHYPSIQEVWISVCKDTGKEMRRQENRRRTYTILSRLIYCFVRIIRNALRHKNVTALLWLYGIR